MMNFFSSPFVQDKEPVTDNTPVDHTDNYKIVVVLDESGSMESIGAQMRKALDDLIKEQKQIKERPCNFTLVKFNNDVRRVVKNKSLSNVRDLTIEDYNPNGSTALYDAIGDTINWFRYERDVLMVIITDGQENASRKYKKDNITKMIKEKEKHVCVSQLRPKHSIAR
jgi:Mg-chelatase subunit ChlD